MHKFNYNRFTWMGCRSYPKKSNDIFKYFNRKTKNLKKRSKNLRTDYDYMRILIHLLRNNDSKKIPVGDRG